MKKNPIILLALSAICAGCTAVTPTTSSSSSDSHVDSSSDVVDSTGGVASSDSVTSDSVSSDDSVSSNDSASSDSSDDSSETPAITIDDVIRAATTADITKIAGGTLTTNTTYGWSGSTTEEVFTYEYGNGSFHMSGKKYGDDYDLYLVFDTDGSVVAIEKDSDGNISKAYTTYYNAALPISDYLGYGSSAYGAEGLVQYLGFTGKNDPNGDLKFGFENNAYYFSFGCLYDSSTFYTVNVSFAVSDGAMTNVNAEVVEYGSDAFVTDDELGTTSLNADASYTTRTLFTIEQDVGTRTFKNPYDLEGFAVTSYTLVDSNNTPIDDTFTMAMGDYPSLKFSSMAPETANLTFDIPQLTVTGGDGLNAYFYSYNSSIGLSASATGTYTLEIKTKKVTKTITVVEELPKPTSVSLAYYAASPSGYNWTEVTDKSMNAYTGVNYYLAPTVSPYSANQSLNVTVDGEEDGYTITETGIYLYSGSTTPVNTYAFNATKAGTYSVSFTSTVDSTIGYTVVITVADAPSFKDILGIDSGFAYRSGSVKYTFNFGSFDETGANGDVSIKDVQNDKTESATYVISKNETTGLYEFTLTHVDGDDLISSFSLGFGADFNLYLVTSYDGYVSASALSVASSKFYLTQYWKGVSGDMTFSAQFWSNGTVDLKMMDSDMFANYYYCANYTVDETPSTDGYAVTISTGDEQQSDSPFFALPATFYLSSDFKTLSASFTCTGDNTDYSYSLAYASAGRGD